MNNKKKKILFLTNIPSPYRVEFFNELGKECELTVLYQKANSSERNEKWIAKNKDTYRSILLRGVSTGVDNSLCPEVIKYLNAYYDNIIICGNASPTEILAIMYCRLRHIPYCLEGDGAFVKKSNIFKEIFKKYLISGGKLFFSTCREHDKYYLHFGADASKIIRYRFTSLLKKDILSRVVTKEEKDSIKKEMGIKEKKVVLAVGQFIYRKGFDLLLKSADFLDNDVGIYIVGDIPTKEYLNQVKKNNISNVHFEGFKTKEELKEYYQASDVFVLPTREDIWGLVINEAMACGLPVITTNKCNAGLELIKNGVNGYIIETENVDELILRIKDVFVNSNGMSRESLKTISMYNIENMVKDHIMIFNNNL